MLPTLLVFIDYTSVTAVMEVHEMGSPFSSKPLNYAVLTTEITNDVGK